MAAQDLDAYRPRFRRQAQVADHPADPVRARIESGDLAPGARLPSIATLTQEYGIARTTAGKALRLLVDEGLAEMSPGMGTFVTRK